MGRVLTFLAVVATSLVTLNSGSFADGSTTLIAFRLSRGAKHHPVRSGVSDGHISKSTGVPRIYKTEVVGLGTVLVGPGGELVVSRDVMAHDLDESSDTGELRLVRDPKAGNGAVCWTRPQATRYHILPDPQAHETIIVSNDGAIFVATHFLCS